ncbi:MAG TPA: hypothetical protein VK737_10565 [Opitutales bacterium]|jgi:hypothetical protein|nr:hypothetical protein [Opitutales bacterium]
MTTPLQKLSLGSILAISGVLTVTALWSRSGDAFAAGTTLTPPNVLIKADIKTGPVTVGAPSGGGGSGGSSGGGKSAGGGGKGGAGSVTTSSKAWVEITITNAGDSVATDLLVDYHVYVKTSVSGGSNSGVTWQDNPDKYTIDTIKPQAKNLQKTALITLTNSTTSSGSSSNSSSKGGGKSSSASSTTTVTSIGGVYLIVTMADADPNAAKPWSKKYSSSDSVANQYKIDNPQG